MLEEMETLEAKISQLLEQHRATREENLRLRQQVISVENTNKQLTDRLEEARKRMEALFNRLPE